MHAIPPVAQGCLPAMPEVVVDVVGKDMDGIVCRSGAASGGPPIQTDSAAEGSEWAPGRQPLFGAVCQDAPVTRRGTSTSPLAVGRDLEVCWAVPFDLSPAKASSRRSFASDRR